MKRYFTVSLFLLVFLLSSNISSPAWAYLDPGTGSMILQILLGGVAGAMVIGRVYWHRVKTFFGRGDARKEPSSEVDK